MGASSIPIKVQCDASLGDQTFARVVETRHGANVARTAIHRQSMPNRIGGVRMVGRAEQTEVDRREVGHLAYAMTGKCMAADIPCDGQKSLIVCPGGLPSSIEARAALVAEHISLVAQIDPDVIFGPDMNVSEEVLDHVAEDFTLRKHLTGLTRRWGGLEIDKDGYTGTGLVHAIDVVRMRRPDLPVDSAIIQGFGAVGAYAARELARLGVVVRGVSTVEGAILARDPNIGLDIDLLFEAWSDGGDAAVRSCALSQSAQVEWTADPERLFGVAADIFVPAAGASVLCSEHELDHVRRVENARAKDVARFADVTRIALVAEGANHPLTASAEEILEARGIVVIPDIIGNAGGVIGCYNEWYHRERLMASTEDRIKIAAAARSCVEEVIRRNTAAVIDGVAGARDATRMIIDDAARRWASLSDPRAEWRQRSSRWLPFRGGRHSKPPQAA